MIPASPLSLTTPPPFSSPPDKNFLPYRDCLFRISKPLLVFGQKFVYPPSLYHVRKKTPPTSAGART